MHHASWLGTAHGTMHDCTHGKLRSHPGWLHNNVQLQPCMRVLAHPGLSVADCTRARLPGCRGMAEPWKGSAHTCDVQGGRLGVLEEAARAVGLAPGDDGIAGKAVVVCLPGRPAPYAQLVAPAARAVRRLARLPCSSGAHHYLCSTGEGCCQLVISTRSLQKQAAQSVIPPQPLMHVQ